MNWVVAVIIGLLIILIIILGLVFIIPRLIPARPAVVALPTPTPTPQYIIPIITPGVTPSVPQTEIFNGTGFTFEHPQSWGLLTCANSLNFELDPTNNIDQIDTLCNVALKPITIVIDNDLTGCWGQNVIIGTIPVIKSITQTAAFTQYMWCTKTNPVLKITHRVSTTPSRAVSTIDYSPDIERIIASLRFSS